MMKHDDVKVAGKLSGVTILIVDDSETTLMILAQLLKFNGAKTHCAHNGVEAIEQYNKSHPDVILMDIQMPVMDGVEATLQLRKLGCECPIIAITAASTAEMSELNVAFTDYVPKPIIHKNLQEKILKHLNSQVV